MRLRARNKGVETLTCTVTFLIWPMCSLVAKIICNTNTVWNTLMIHLEIIQMYQKYSYSSLELFKILKSVGGHRKMKIW